MGVEGEFTDEEVQAVKAEHEWLRNVSLPKKE